jgi:hypothetical protein
VRQLSTKTKNAAKVTNEAGLIPADVAARLLMIDQREFDRLVRADWIAPEQRNPVRYQLVAVVQGFLKYQQHERTRGRTVAEVAEHLGISVKRVNELIDRNVIERKPRGDYSLGPLPLMRRRPKLTPDCSARVIAARVTCVLPAKPKPSASFLKMKMPSWPWLPPCEPSAPSTASKLIA